MLSDGSGQHEIMVTDETSSHIIYLIEPNVFSLHERCTSYFSARLEMFTDEFLVWLNLGNRGFQRLPQLRRRD